MHPEKIERRTEEGAILREIVDQFLERQVHPPADYKQFEQLTLGMIDILEAPAVARILRPLCSHPEISQTIFDRLRDKGGPCVELAVQFSPYLGRDEMMAAARGADPVMAGAVGRRADLDADIIVALLRRGEAATLRALAENQAVKFDASVRRVLIEAARSDRAFARALLDRDDFGAEDEALFLAANRQERGNMILNAIRRTLASGRGALSVEPEVAARLEAAALRRDRDAMTAIFAEAFRCRKLRARMILDDPRGEPLALALAALGVNPDAATRVFLCADPAIAHDTATVRDLVQMVRLVPPRAAAEIIVAATGGWLRAGELAHTAPIDRAG